MIQNTLDNFTFCIKHYSPQYILIMKSQNCILVSLQYSWLASVHTWASLSRAILSHIFFLSTRKLLTSILCRVSNSWTPGGTSQQGYHHTDQQRNITTRRDSTFKEDTNILTRFVMLYIFVTPSILS